MTESLASALARIARTEVLLVGLDFDGTLAPIVEHPDQAQADRTALTALRELAGAPDCHVAVISGRPLADLRVRCPVPSAVHLVGSHGAEADGDEQPVLSDSRRQLAAVVHDRLAELASHWPGTLVERKPLGASFHTRTARDRQVASQAPELVRAALADLTDVHLLLGHEVVEVTVVPVDKGRALERLRAEVRATAVCFVGDDMTDERAFARLGIHDVGVKVGPGATAAAFRISGQHEVAPLLGELAALRRAGRGEP